MTVENGIKAIYGLVMIVSLYFGLDKKFSLLEQKVDLYIEHNLVETIKTTIDIDKLKDQTSDNRMEIVQLKAILPRELKFENK